MSLDLDYIPSFSSSVSSSSSKLSSLITSMDLAEFKWDLTGGFRSGEKSEKSIDSEVLVGWLE